MSCGYAVPGSVLEPTKLTLKTADVAYAGTDDKVSFTAHTSDGGVCQFGNMDLAGYNDRERGQLDFIILVFSEFVEIESKL